uniref:uDENN domain-containing protein n=1 Tax=Hucho hucho TaxID=62062 RepID=A0A4W5NGT7_9TELE
MGSRIKDNPEATFEVYLEVTHPGTAGSDPEVRRRFPEDYIDQETLQTVPKFCFPFSVDRQGTKSTLTIDDPIVSPYSPCMQPWHHPGCHPLLRPPHTTVCQNLILQPPQHLQMSSLPGPGTKSLIHALISSQVDYCNTLLSDINTSSLYNGSKLSPTLCPGSTSPVLLPFP